MRARFDKVILLEDDKGKLAGIIVHDIESHHQLHYTVSEMGAEELAGIYEISSGASMNTVVDSRTSAMGSNGPDMGGGAGRRSSLGGKGGTA